MAELFFTLEFLNFVWFLAVFFSNLKKINHKMWQWTKNFQQLSPTEKSSLFFSNTKRHKLARKRVLYMWQADKTFIKTNSNFVFGYSTRPLFPFDSLFFFSHCLFDRTKLSFPSNPIRFEFLWLTSQRAFFFCHLISEPIHHSPQGREKRLFSALLLWQGGKYGAPKCDIFIAKRESKCWDSFYSLKKKKQH